MEVDQKYITNIRLHDAKGNELRLCKKGDDYQLQLSSDSHVVNISLGVEDVRRLCQQVVQLDIEENWKAHQVTPPEFRSFFFQGTPRPVHEIFTNWYSRMASDMCDGHAKR